MGVTGISFPAIPLPGPKLDAQKSKSKYLSMKKQFAARNLQLSQTKSKVINALDGLKLQVDSANTQYQGDRILNASSLPKLAPMRYADGFTSQSLSDEQEANKKKLLGQKIVESIRKLPQTGNGGRTQTKEKTVF